MLSGPRRRPRGCGIRITRLEVDVVDDDNGVMPWLGRIFNGCNAHRLWMRPDRDDHVVVAAPGVVTKYHAAWTDKLFVEERDASILSGTVSHEQNRAAGRAEHGAEGTPGLSDLPEQAVEAGSVLLAADHLGVVRNGHGDAVDIGHAGGDDQLVGIPGPQRER